MEFPLRHTKGHIIVTIEGDDWLVDTGSPVSFGSKKLVLGGEAKQLPTGLMGIGTEFLSAHTDIPLSGLLGTDILNSYDVVFDLPSGLIGICQEVEVWEGNAIPIDFCLGVPVLSALINGESLRCFFDTGAQVSYAPAMVLRPEERIGTFRDFYPTQGDFETDLHWVDLELENKSFRIRCGAVPDFLAGMMGIAGASGIIGNDILLEHRTCYLPRRKVVVVA